MTGFKTETEVKAIIDNAVKSIENAAKSFVYKRTAKPTGITWTALIVVKVKQEKSMDVINALKPITLSNEIDVKFAGSEMNIQNTDFETDYIMLVAEIRP